MNNFVHLWGFFVVKMETLEKFLRGRIVGSKGNVSILCQIPLKRGYTILIIHQPGGREPHLLYNPAKRGLSSRFLIFASLVGQEWYSNIVLNWNSVVIRELVIFSGIKDICEYFCKPSFLAVVHFSIKFLVFFFFSFFPFTF